MKKTDPKRINFSDSENPHEVLIFASNDNNCVKTLPLRSKCSV